MSQTCTIQEDLVRVGVSHARRWSILLFM